MTPSASLCRPPSALEPQLEHEQQPNYAAVVVRVLREPHGAEVVDKFGPYDATFPKPRETVERQVAQRTARHDPVAERHTEAVLFLPNDLDREKITERLLEKVA